MANENPPLVWVDCEMTGLDLGKDALIEIAVLVTDENLNVLGDGIDLVIRIRTTRKTQRRRQHEFC
jgi:oligoribonuclease